MKKVVLFGADYMGRILDYVQGLGNSSLIKRIKVEAGKSLSYQYHAKRKEYWIVISGEGILTLEGEKSVLEEGSLLEIPCSAKHMLTAATNMELIEVQVGPGELEEEDIVRLAP